MSESFWRQTLTAFALHPVIVLLYAAPVATQRAWALLRSKPLPAWWLPSLEALVFLWRLLMCAVAVWVVLTPAQAAAMRAAISTNASIQNGLDILGEKLGKQLWLLSWEILLCLIVFFLLNLLLNVMARLWVRSLDMELEQKRHQRMALTAAARNLLLVPLALIYAAVVVRHVLMQG